MTRTQTTGRDLAYERISLDTERSGSLDKQHERLSAAVAAAGRDPERIVWFRDESVSGSRDVQRPGRDSLLKQVRSGDRVLVTKLDRLARNVNDLLNIVRHVESVGASVRFIDNDINTDGPFGRFMLVLLAAIAELEAGIIGERRRESLESFARQGRHAVGKAPLGLMSVENPSGRGLVLVKHPEEAPRVREAVMRVLGGEPQNSVRESLGLSKTGFHNLLTNPRLAGMTPRNGGVVLVDGVPLVNPEAAILTPAEWQRLSAFMSRREGKAWSRQNGYGRALACSECGSRLYVNLSKRNPNYSTYRCRKPEGTHLRGEPEVGVMVHAANDYVPAEFLTMWGSEPYRVAAVTEDDTARREAIAAANIRITELDRRMRGAERTERERLNADLMAAYDALDDAQALPTERRETVSETGQDIAAVWAEADDAERERIICAFGRFVVRSGTKGRPVTERIVWEGLRPDMVQVNGRPGRVVLVDAPETEQTDLYGGSRTLPAGLRVEIRPA